MKIKLFASGVIAIVLCIASGQVFAHHGNVAFDMTKPVVLQNATVTDFKWINPHVIVKFDVKDAQGNIVHWSAEGGSVQALRPYGWSLNSIHAGDTATIYVFPAKAGTPMGIVNKFVFPDGRQLMDLAFGGTPADRAAYEKSRNQQQ